MSAPRGPIDFARRHCAAIAIAISVALGVAYLIWQPQTLDLAAQTFRADLWERDGFVIWNPDWYGGHTIPGYSLLYPPLGAWLGPAWVGVLSGVSAAALFAAIALRAYGERAWLGIIWFGLASMVAVYGGRTTWALGLAIGLACMLAVQRERPVAAGVTGALAALASPLAGLFTALAAVAVVLARRSPSQWLGRSGGPIAAAVAGAGGALFALALIAIAFPTDGFQLFVFSAWVWIPIAVVAVLTLVGIDHAVIRWGAVLYLGLATAALIAETPLGGNAVRLGATFAGPLLAIALIGRRPLALALIAVPLLYWQWTATVRDVASASGDPSVEASYYHPVLDEILKERVEGGERIHVSPTRNRWEAVHVAERLPIVTGWLRQLELEDEDLLGREELDPEEYRAWLASKGGSLVAVSDAEPDWLFESERELFDSGAFDGDLVAEEGPWRLYRLAEPAPIADAEPDRVELIAEPGATELALDYTPYMEVTAGNACVQRGETGRVVIENPAPRPQRVVVEVKLSLDALLGRDRDCA